MSRYSFPALVLHALRGHKRWPRALRSADPKPSYDAVIVGGGGHGLATAYFLAKQHGMRRIAVLEKGAIGHGNSGRNTQVVRSDYYHLPSSKFFERSLRLYEGLSRELNYNIMLSQRGKINLAHSPHEMEMQRRDGECDPHERRRCGHAVGRGHPQAGARAQLQRPLSDRGWLSAMAWRPRASRRGRLGLRARGLQARRRHRAGLRGHRIPDSRAIASPASRRHAATSRHRACAWRLPDIRACLRARRASCSRSTAWPCRPWSRSRSSRCSITC